MGFSLRADVPTDTKIKSSRRDRRGRSAQGSGETGRAAGAGGGASDRKSERLAIMGHSDLRWLAPPPAWLRQAASFALSCCDFQEISALGKLCESSWSWQAIHRGIRVGLRRSASRL